jgi:hypothetical protein
VVGAETVVVEVVSPTDRAAAVADKALRWIELGRGSSG